MPRTLLRQQDVDAEKVYRQNGIDNLKTLFFHEGAEAFVGLGEALGLLLGNHAEANRKFNRISLSIAPSINIKTRALQAVMPGLARRPSQNAV